MPTGYEVQMYNAIALLPDRLKEIGVQLKRIADLLERDEPEPEVSNTHLS